MPANYRRAFVNDSMTKLHGRKKKGPRTVAALSGWAEGSARESDAQRLAGTSRASSSSIALEATPAATIVAAKVMNAAFAAIRLLAL